MNDDESSNEELKGAGYEIFVGALSVLSIANIALMYAVQDANLDTVLLAMNALLSVVFLGDFAYRLLTAPSRSTYFFRQYGWADLAASIPIQQFKVLRIFRLLRVYRLLRAYGARRIVKSLVVDRAESALLTLLLMGILVLEFGSLAILRAEQHVDGANILTASDALWYVVVTISTVGYGDRFPVTTHGRYIGTVIIIIGVGIFGTFTGYLANLFLAPRKAQTAASTETTAGRIEQLKGLLAQQQATVDELGRLLSSER